MVTLSSCCWQHTPGLARTRQQQQQMNGDMVCPTSRGMQDGRIETVRLLLAHDQIDANVATTDDISETPPHVCSGGHAEIVRLTCCRNARRKGICAHHCKKEKCFAKGCSSNAVDKGLCVKHGAKGICSMGFCTSGITARRRCSRHGGGSKKVCKREGCSTLAHARSLCQKHGAYGKCQTAGCTTGLTKLAERIALQETRRKQEEAVLRGEVHHSLGTHGSLRQTRRRCRQMLDQ